MAGPWEKYAAPSAASGAGPWTKYAAPAPAEPEPPKPDYMNAPQVPSAGLSQGITAGFGDEIMAGAFTPIEMAIAAYKGQDVGKSLGQRASEAYDRSLKRERDVVKRAEAESPIGTAAEGLVGAVVNPINKVLPSAGVYGGAAGGMLGGGLYGFGGGEGGFVPRAIEAGKGMLIGGPLGAAFGKLAGPAASAPRVANPVVEAGDRLGVQVPRFVASESMPVQRLASVERNIPFAGDKLVKAFDATKEGLGKAADDVAAGLGGSNVPTAGSSASSAIKNHMTTELSAVADHVYKGVDKAIAGKSGMLHDMPETQGVVANILARRMAAGIDKNGAAVDTVANALQRGKLSYEGLKELRTRFGSNVPDDVTTDVVGAEFKQLYGALTKDLGNAVEAQGGKAGRTAWEHANHTFKQISARREDLAKIVGAKGDAAPEAVFSRLQAMASSGSRADVGKLMQAKKAMGQQAWDESAGTILSNMGRDAEGLFSPDRFITAWGKMSDGGKSALFGAKGAHREALEDIHTISSRMKELNKFANPSGTAQNVIGGGLATGAGFMAPLTTLTTVVGNMAISKVLASPVTAASAAKWTRAYDVLVRKPAAGSVAVFQRASRNLSATIADKMGLNVDPSMFLRATYQHAPARADEDDK